MRTLKKHVIIWTNVYHAILLKEGWKLYIDVNLGMYVLYMYIFILTLYKYYILCLNIMLSYVVIYA